MSDLGHNHHTQLLFNMKRIQKFIWKFFDEYQDFEKFLFWMKRGALDSIELALVSIVDFIVVVSFGIISCSETTTLKFPPSLDQHYPKTFPKQPRTMFAQNQFSYTQSAENIVHLFCRNLFHKWWILNFKQYLFALQSLNGVKSSKLAVISNFLFVV